MKIFYVCAFILVNLLVIMLLLASSLMYSCFHKMHMIARGMRNIMGRKGLINSITSDIKQ